MRLPVVEHDVLADVAIAELVEDRQDPPVIGPGGERAAEPRPGVDADDLADHPLRRPDVRPDPGRRQERQPGVIEAVVPDQVPVARDPPRQVRMGLDPAALEEPRRPDAPVREDVEDRLGHARPVRPVRMLGVERQRDPDRGVDGSPERAAPTSRPR